MQKQEEKVTDAQIKTWVQRDLETAISGLNMIRQDPEMLDAITAIVIRRVRAKEENEALQPELDLKPTE